jgi:DNA-binding response OmpR family regulator
LSASGFAVDHVASAERARAAFAAEVFDAAVVDIGLPGEDGLALVRHLRGMGKTIPILILTARQTTDDKVVALELGADDFLPKPYEPAELVARCRALIRRATLANRGELSLGRMKVDLSGKQLTIDGNDVALTAREWAVFDCLARNVGKIVAKERLLQAIASWDNEVSPNAVEVYVSRLRLKLGDAANIRTVRGLGYRLEEKK